MPDFNSEDTDLYERDNCCLSKKNVDLLNCFRLLWLQHVYWTRMVILSIAFDLPDLEETSKRLLRNAPDLAKVFCHFYGSKTASVFEALLTDHLTIAAELVVAAKAGNTNEAADAERRWYKNADEIVFILNHINSCWSVESMQQMWYTHLALTKDEAVAILNKKYSKSIKIFNQIEKEILIMADDFFNGITTQFDM